MISKENGRYMNKNKGLLTIYRNNNLGDLKLR